MSDARNLVARSITFLGDDGCKTVMNARGFETVGPGGAAIKAYIDDNFRPTIELLTPEASFAFCLCPRPAIVAIYGNEKMAINSSGVNFAAGSLNAGLEAGGIVIVDGERDTREPHYRRHWLHSAIGAGWFDGAAAFQSARSPAALCAGCVPGCPVYCGAADTGATTAQTRRQS